MKFYLVEEEDLINLTKCNQNMILLKEVDAIDKEKYGAAFSKWLSSKNEISPEELVNTNYLEMYNSWARDYIQKNFPTFDLNEEKLEEEFDEEPINGIIN